MRPSCMPHQRTLTPALSLNRAREQTLSPALRERARVKAGVKRLLRSRDTAGESAADSKILLATPAGDQSPAEIRYEFSSDYLYGIATSPINSRAIMIFITFKPPSAPTTYESKPRNSISSGVSVVYPIAP